MICPGCADGDHCNNDGCTCGHRPPGTGQPQRTGRMECAPVPTTFTPKAWTPPTADMTPEAEESLREAMERDPYDIGTVVPSGPLSAPVAAAQPFSDAGDQDDPTAASDARLRDYLSRWHNNREASGS